MIEVMVHSTTERHRASQEVGITTSQEAEVDVEVGVLTIRKTTIKMTKDRIITKEMINNRAKNIIRELNTKSENTSIKSLNIFKSRLLKLATWMLVQVPSRQTRISRTKENGPITKPQAPTTPSSQKAQIINMTPLPASWQIPRIKTINKIKEDIRANLTIVTEANKNSMSTKSLTKGIILLKGISFSFKNLIKETTPLNNISSNNIISIMIHLGIKITMVKSNNTMVTMVLKLIMALKATNIWIMDMKLSIKARILTMMN